MLIYREGDQTLGLNIMIARSVYKPPGRVHLLAEAWRAPRHIIIDLRKSEGRMQIL